MPKRTDINSILIIGAGPIVIGQACEFDYSGAQACKALREEGYKVVLVNSNPATIMTDPDMADVTYIEPITWQVVAAIIEKERPQAVLPTMGGQTALNCALDLHRHGVLDKFGVELIGATPEAIDKAEDRSKFKDAMTRIGLGSARSGIAHTMAEAWVEQEKLGFPVIIRPSFTMGGSGGGIAHTAEEFLTICTRGLELSPTSELLIEESLLGWKEFEMEVVRDRKDNCIIVCSIENLDPMGVHTGDSITVAPAQTMTDKEYQIMRNASLNVLREIGVDTGGSNVQFALNPKDGRMIVIEMNPRGLYPGRTAQRHHRRRHPGIVRTGHRLRGDQGAPFRVREIPRRGPAPDHADEIRGRSDGDGPHVPGIVPESLARPGYRHGWPAPRQHRPGRDCAGTGAARPAAYLVRGRSVRAGHDPGRSARIVEDRSLVPGADPRSG
jgi:carbamoylphosphate synthase large subunit